MTKRQKDKQTNRQKDKRQKSKKTQRKRKKIKRQKGKNTKLQNYPSAGAKRRGPLAPKVLVVLYIQEGNQIFSQCAH